MSYFANTTWKYTHTYIGLYIFLKRALHKYEAGNWGNSDVIKQKKKSYNLKNIPVVSRAVPKSILRVCACPTVYSVADNRHPFITRDQFSAGQIYTESFATL
jgi:hypothetical protein